MRYFRGIESLTGEPPRAAERAGEICCVDPLRRFRRGFVGGNRRGGVTVLATSAAPQTTARGSRRLAASSRRSVPVEKRERRIGLGRSTLRRRIYVAYLPSGGGGGLHPPPPPEVVVQVAPLSPPASSGTTRSAACPIRHRPGCRIRSPTLDVSKPPAGLQDPGTSTRSPSLPLNLYPTIGI